MWTLTGFQSTVKTFRSIRNSSVVSSYAVIAPRLHSLAKQIKRTHPHKDRPVWLGIGEAVERHWRSIRVASKERVLSVWASDTWKLSGEETNLWMNCLTDLQVCTSNLRSSYWMVRFKEFSSWKFGMQTQCTPKNSAKNLRKDRFVESDE